MDYCRGTETILLVEDEEALRRLMEEMLRALGYHVIGAVDGKQALTMAKNHSGNIDVLITDVTLPELDGMKLADSLLSNRPSMKVLFISGDTERGSRLQPGMERLQKPFTIRMLSAKVRELLGA